MRKILFILSLLTFLKHNMAAQDDLLKILQTEVNRNASVLKEQSVPAYYVSYRLYDIESYQINSSFGNLVNSSPNRQRLFHAVVRVGNHEMDNTRELKGENFGSSSYTGSNQLPLDNDAHSIQLALWLKTDELYKEAVTKYENVKANVAVKVASEDKSNDFSNEKPEKYYDKPVKFDKIKPDINKWEDKIKRIGTVFNENKDILNAGVHFSVELVRKYFVDSDGAEIVENSYACRIAINAGTTAEDGMSLPLYQSYFAHNPADLPSEEQIIADAKSLSSMISALRKAPVAESYSGPALMTAKASGVFFHEIFGHRIEGARLKKESDAQTFKKKVGELVLPEDFSVIFDPKLKTYRGLPLSGDYIFDDEGVRGQKVTIVDKGRLNSFLMSRTPIDGFSNSNGHGRGMIYYNTVTRQSNMFIESANPKTEQELTQLLIEEAKKNNKEYGYIFDEVAGGFTTTGRYMPNAFNVTPLVVYRVYVDGRPNELVRGVDLVGTPLAMFSQISACGKEFDVFNGYCGAESGSIPVSCVAPTIFVKMIETQKKPKSQNQPPILERP